MQARAGSLLFDAATSAATRGRACGLSAQRGSSTGHGWGYTMSPTIADCLENARQCEWYAANSYLQHLLTLRKNRYGYHSSSALLKAWTVEGSGGRDHSLLRLFEPSQISVRSPGSAGADQPPED